ncbi:putative glycosyltransferase [Gordonia alkanivorans NBRC 16433]|uniref:Putative glycosyltransferase n=1 Tax=Gordonia alkanivorans NBRC 16433 TaxID=1027371 RepID=F9VVB8_9ACTN|nr:putative glycosyltransferase [Gordonia alkanivorans NBRC 16433]
MRNKGYDLLAQALGDRRIQDAVGKSLRWTHFGDGAALDSVRAYANDHGVDLRIRSGCSDEEVQSELSGADLFVQPSRYEGSSLTTLEAMVHGRRIVATPVGGIVDKVIDGVTGHLAAEVTVESIAEAILRALGDEENSCGRGAMEAVNGRFSSEAESLLYQHLYKSLAEARLLKRSVS